MTEHWRGIPGFPDYEASSLGKVRRATDGMNTWRGRVLRTTINPQDRLVVTLINATGRYTVGIHKAVLLAFQGPRRGLVARHLNGDHRDNRVENLRWGTVTENAQDRIAHGRHPMGEKSNLAKLTAAKVRFIRRNYGTWTQQELADKYGITQAAVSAILTRKNWKHIL